MRYDSIQATKPTWVRIVNPEPFSIPVFGYEYRYGDVLLTGTGGRFLPISDDGRRVLAIYRAPHPPFDRLDCPSDALVFATPRDLRLAAKGEVGYLMPRDPELETGMGGLPRGPPAVSSPDSGRACRSTARRASSRLRSRARWA